MESREDNKENVPFLAKIRSMYKATKNSTNVAIGTEPESYERWAELHALEKGLSRLHELMKSVPPSQESMINQEDKTHMELSSFEHELIYNFEKDEFICKPPIKLVIQGVQGICDWVGSGLSSPSGTP
eukprot:15331515-Ditylum_brightwellii.AAC.1